RGPPTRTFASRRVRDGGGCASAGAAWRRGHGPHRGLAAARARLRLAELAPFGRSRGACACGARGGLAPAALAEGLRLRRSRRDLALRGADRAGALSAALGHGPLVAGARDPVAGDR